MEKEYFIYKVYAALEMPEERIEYASIRSFITFGYNQFDALKNCSLYNNQGEHFGSPIVCFKYTKTSFTHEEFGYLREDIKNFTESVIFDSWKFFCLKNSSDKITKFPLDHPFFKLKPTNEYYPELDYTQDIESWPEVNLSSPIMKKAFYYGV